MKRLISVCTALMLVLSAGLLIPASTIESYAFAGGRAAGTAMTQDAPWYDSIPEMLAAGEYEEGVVIAGIDMSKAKKSGDPGSALDSKKLKSGAEEIIRIDSDDTGSQQEFVSWFQQLKESLSGQQSDSICITSIRRDDMTTEQILKLLAFDDSVVFAEPNYIIDMEAEEDDVTEDDPAPAESEDTDDKATESVGNAGGDNTLLKDAEPAAKAAEEDDETPAEEVPAAKAAEADDETPAEEVPVGKAGGTDGDGTQFQWSSSEDSSFHSKDKSGDVSIKVPGWSDGSNMDHEIIVAVMDMPVDYRNPDLENCVYRFSPEQMAALGCGEYGYNAMWDAKNGELVFEDGAHHGTHVAGIIGASWNGKGINGVGSNVKIVSVQNSLLRFTSLIDSLRGYSFIKRAVEKGIDIRIVNNSWRLEQSSKALDAAVTELGEQGVISIFAAGNQAEDMNTAADITSLLANNPYAIKVASTTPAGELADSSCYGKGLVDLGAPGACILSCVPMSSASYLPFLAENNKFYENFEDGESGSSDNISVKVSQVGFDTVPNKWGGTDDIVNPDKVISGTEGVVVSGSEDMGFEGKKVLKIKIDRSELAGMSDDHAALKIDLGNVSALGVEAGDTLTFVYGSDKELEPISIESGGSSQYVFYEKNNRNCWNTFSYILGEGVNTDHLTLFMTIVTNGAEEIYLDTFGIGDDSQKQPYAFLSGTSMAAPAVSGSAAVIASRHYSELEEMNASSAKKLADLVRSSVRPLAALKDMTSTGGIIDLTVDTKLSDPDADQPGPDITDLTVSGNKVTLTGTGFGSAPGTAKVRKYVIGDPSDVDASVTSWSDREAVLALGEDFKGIIEVTLTKADSEKEDTIVKYISKSSNIFENDLTLLSGTGDPLAFDEDDSKKLGDYETSGLLAAGDDDLYYLPQMTKVELNPAYKSMYCYHPATDSWEECSALPEWIKEASCAWLDGKLYVKGTSVDVDESGTVPHYEREDDEDSGETFVFSYDPRTHAWKRCSNKGVAYEFALFTDGNKLMMAGLSEDDYYESEGGYPTVRDYDPEAGAGGHEILLRYSVRSPKAAFAGGYVYLFDFDFFTSLIAIDCSKPEDEPVEIQLPEFYFGAAPERRADDENRVEKNDIVLLSCDDTLILTGFAANDGSSDTFTLKAGETAFKPFSKRVSDAEVLLPSAAVLDGRLYVIGASDFEPDKRVFRSTMLAEPVAEKFTITYDLNGGSFGGSKDNISEEYEKDTVISIHDAPERDGYTFSYWKGSEYRPDDKYTVTEDHTFVAQWEKADEPGNASGDETDSGDNATGSGSKVRTGDESHAGIWLAITLLAALEMIILLLALRKKNDTEKQKS